VRHRGSHAARQGFHEGKTGGNSFTLTGDQRLTLHGVGLLVGAPNRNGDTSRQTNKKRIDTRVMSDY
jgi:hypothetical protein